MNKYLLSLLLILTALTACDHTASPVPEPPVPVDRVVLVYMEARNNLSGEALDDLAEMKRAEIPAGNRLLVYRSRYGEPHPDLIEIFQGGDSVLKSYADTVLATDPAQMARVISDVHQLAPAKEFGMIFWSHASGWRRKSARAADARGFGSENGRMMTVTQMASALGRDRKIDFLFFDCCYMGCAEVAYELRNSARYFVASVCEVPAGGMPYHLTVPELFNPDMVEGLKNTIDLNVDYYRNATSVQCPSTLALVDLSKMDELIEAVRPTIGGKVPYSFLWQRFSRNAPYRDMFTDLGQYMEALGGTMPEGVILHEDHTDSVWGTISLSYCIGLSIFYPNFATGIDYTYKGYDTLEWAKYLNLNASLTPEAP